MTGPDGRPATARSAEAFRAAIAAAAFALTEVAGLRPGPAVTGQDGRPGDGKSAARSTEVLRAATAAATFALAGGPR